jgi:hypothetical protein
VSSGAPGRRRPLGIKDSLGLSLAALVVVYLGFASLRGVVEGLRLNALFREGSRTVPGVLLDHDLKTMMDHRRTSLYFPVVEYRVENIIYQVTAQVGVDLKDAVVTYKESTPMEVRYLADRPEVARVIGLEKDNPWFLGFVSGILLMGLPIAGLALGIIHGKLFVAGEGTSP